MHTASWRSLYDITKEDSGALSVEDRKVFCSGICSVLMLLPTDDCHQAIAALSEPVLLKIENALKMLEPTKQDRNSSQSSQPHFTALSEDVQILSTIIYSFHNHNFNCEINEFDYSSVENNGNIQNPLRSLLQTSWPALSHIALTYSWNERIASSLFDLLRAAVSIYHNGASPSNFLNELNKLATAILDKSSPEAHANTIVSLIDYVTSVTDAYGPLADKEQIVHESTASIPGTQFSADLEVSLYLAINASKFLSSQTQAPDIISGIIKLCCVCMKSCPKTLLNLPVVPGEQGKDGQLLARIIERSLVGVSEQEVDVARQSMLFLRDLVCLLFFHAIGPFSVFA